MASPLTTWTDTHRADALDLIRIYLGLGLMVRGVVFLAAPEAYAALLPGGAESLFATFWLAHYVALAHLGGGLLLMLGVLTRLAAAVQLPILAGAAFLVHLPADGPLSQSFGFAALVLVLLAVLTAFGGGRWSLDQAVGRWAEAREAREAAESQAYLREVRERARPEPAQARPPAPTSSEATCTCGHDRAHPHVTVEREYAGLRKLRFATGTHARPSKATYRCGDCGGVVDVVTDPEGLERLRYVHGA